MATSPTRRWSTRLIAEHGIGAILHFAGSVVVPESVADPLKYYRNNTAASRTLIERAVAGGVGHFIFSSTAAVYGTPRDRADRRGRPTQPINPYGWSKLMTEAMLPTPPPRIRSTPACCAISTSPAPIRRAARASRPPAPPT